MISPVSWATSATVAFTAMRSARSLAQESVIGIGQNRPVESFMSTQQLRQSSRPMKPASGV
jgi:hypothetical protein